LQLIVDCLDFGLSPKEAVTAPRFGTSHMMSSFGQAPPQLGNVLVYPNIGDSVIQSLKERGANVTLQKVAWGRPVVVRVNSQTGVIEAAGDPTAKRNAGAY
jgi:gamma-glutamyltranspeptidase